jgi:diguanylate cyclase (GGDEF)-like protein
MAETAGGRQKSRRPRVRWYSGVLWAGIFAITVLTMGWVMRMESDQVLRHDAELSAARWAGALTATLPEPERLFTGVPIDAATRARIAKLGGQDAVYQILLFDLNGKPVLRSGDVGDPRRQSMDASLPALLRAGVRQAQISRDAIDAGPEVYGVVDLAVTHQGRPIGLARLLIDETPRAQAADAGLQRIVVVVSLLLAIIGAMAAYQHVSSRRAQRATEKRLRYVAAHDALSGALNRASLMTALTRACTANDPQAPTLALLRIDLDRFQDINDSFGHAVGDAVLRTTTKRLKTCLGPRDQLARLEADEFAMLLVGPGTRDAVLPIVRTVQQVLAEPMELSGQLVRSNASIGIALHGDDSSTPDTLMAHAELALSRAKSSGRGTFRFHDAERDQEVVAQRALTRDLRDALSRGQLRLNYQPLFDNDGVTLVGYEALLRWHHGDQGEVSPAVFVPLAETAGLIDTIGLWALRQACADASGWPTSLGVAVNLSSNQFASGELVRQVSRALADTGLAPERLCLEITESVLLSNSEQVMQTLQNLRALGVSIAMDDFGTGFSSLAYLWRFPFDKIKIDQVFTKNMLRDPKVAMIVRSIVMLAHALEIRVNAEGVETIEQRDALQQLGCHELQGFLLGRPAPTASLTHDGHAPVDTAFRSRAEVRESLFATLAMELPAPHPGI